MKASTPSRTRPALIDLRGEAAAAAEAAVAGNGVQGRLGWSRGVPWGTPRRPGGPQRAAVRPTWAADGLRTAKLRRMTALEGAMRPVSAPGTAFTAPTAAVAARKKI